MSLKSIAKEAKTSISTVSRVLNNSEHKCNDNNLAERIWEIAKKQGYTPNATARNLRIGKDDKDNKFTVDIFLTRFESMDKDSFFSELFLYLKEDILNQGCLLGDILSTIDIISDTDNDNNISSVPYKTFDDLKNQRNINPMGIVTHKNNTGLIILGKCPNELIPILKKRYNYISAVDRNPTDYEYDEVICNGMTAAEKAVEHLISLGHRSIAYIGDCTYETRYIGYYQALLNHKIALNYKNIFPSNQTAEDGYRIMKNILQLDNRPTGIFCANDSTALGVLRAIKSSKIRGYLPSIISIDNIKESENTEPMLTTIDIPKKEMGHLALMLLLDRKNGKHSKNVRVELPCHLIERESCNYI